MEKSEAIDKHWNRKIWLHYLMGYLTSKGFRLTRDYVKSFKKAFPEIPDDLIELIVEKDKSEEKG